MPPTGSQPVCAASSTSASEARSGGSDSISSEPQADERRRHAALAHSRVDAERDADASREQQRRQGENGRVERALAESGPRRAGRYRGAIRRKSKRSARAIHSRYCVSIGRFEAELGSRRCTWPERSSSMHRRAHSLGAASVTTKRGGRGDEDEQQREGRAPQQRSGRRSLRSARCGAGVLDCERVGAPRELRAHQRWLQVDETRAGADVHPRRREVEHRQVLGEDPLHLVEQTLALRLVGASRSAASSARRSARSQSVAGVVLPEFQKCAPPELSQKSLEMAGSMSVVVKCDHRGFEVAADDARSNRVRSRAARCRARRPPDGSHRAGPRRFARGRGCRGRRAR